MERRGWTKSVFETWFSLIPKHHRVYDKKLALLSLTSIFALPFNSLPPLIQAGARQIVATLVKVAADLETQKKRMYNHFNSIVLNSFETKLFKTMELKWTS